MLAEPVKCAVRGRILTIPSSPASTASHLASHAHMSISPKNGALPTCELKFYVGEASSDRLAKLSTTSTGSRCGCGRESARKSERARKHYIPCLQCSKPSQERDFTLLGIEEPSGIPRTVTESAPTCICPLASVSVPHSCGFLPSSL